MEQCQECGFIHDVGAVPSAGDRIVQGVAEISRLLKTTTADIRTRPQPDTWSVLEYTCHVRDVLLVRRERVLVARRTDRPLVATMGIDERVEHDGYAEQSVDDVERQVTEAARLLANVLGRLGPQDWERTTVMHGDPEPSEWSLRRLAVDAEHEVRHHLLDIRRQLTGPGPEAGPGPGSEPESAPGHEPEGQSADGPEPSRGPARWFHRRWLLGQALVDLDDWPPKGRQQAEPSVTLDRLNWSIKWHTIANRQAMRWYKVFKIVQIAAAAAIPVITLAGGNSAITKGWIAGLGALIVVLEGIQQLKKYLENGLLWGQGKEALKREYYLYQAGVRPYDGRDRQQQLASRIEKIIGTEVAKWADLSHDTQQRPEDDPVGSEPSTPAAGKPRF
jgi:hypothetical protein